MIDDALQESAALYALGTLRGEELHAFEQQLAASGELQVLVRSLRESADGLAFALPPVAPPAVLRERVLGGAQEEPKPQNVIPFPPAAKSRAGLRVAVAAVLVVPVGLAVYFAADAQKARAGTRRVFKELTKLEDEVGGITAERDSLEADKDALTKALRIAEASVASVMKDLETSGTMLKKLEAELAARKTENSTLAQQVANLQKRRLADQAHIALLAATPKGQKAVAVSLWDQSKQEGIVVVENLPALKADKNYQLWVLDDGKPVSAGLLQLDSKGGGRIEFKPRAAIKLPSLFAVTIEPLGEQPAPTLKDLVLAGK